MSCLICQDGKSLSTGWSCNICGRVKNPSETVDRLRDEAKGLVRNFYPLYMSPDIGSRFVDCIIDCAVEIAQAQKEGKG